MGHQPQGVPAAYLRDSLHLTQEETGSAVITHQPPNLWGLELDFPERTDRNGHATHGTALSRSEMY